MMTKKSSLTRKVLISSVLLLGFVGNALGASGQAVMNNIDTNDVVNNVSIEHSVETKKSTNSFLSSLFGIQSASAGYKPDSSYSSEDLEIFKRLTDIRGTTFEKVILSSVKKGILKGYTSEKLFKPNKEVSYIEGLAIIYNSMDKVLEVPKYSSPADSHWSIKLKKLYNDQDKTNLRSYSDSSSIHRDFAIYLMLRSIGIEFNDSDYYKFNHTFGDVTSKSKFAPYLAFAGETKISNGYGDGTFGSKLNKKISRGETAAFASKILRMKSTLQKTYKQKTGRTASIVYTKTTKIESQKHSGGSYTPPVVVKDPVVKPVAKDPIVKPVVKEPVVKPVVKEPIVNANYPNDSHFKPNPLISNTDYSNWQKGEFADKYQMNTKRGQDYVNKYASIGIDITKVNPHKTYDAGAGIQKTTNIISVSNTDFSKTRFLVNDSKNGYGLYNPIYQAPFGELKINSEGYKVIFKGLFTNNKNGLGFGSNSSVFDLEKLPGIDYVKAAKAQNGKDAYIMVKKAIQVAGLSQYARFNDKTLSVSGLWNIKFDKSKKYILKTKDYFNRGTSSFLFNR